MYKEKIIIIIIILTMTEKEILSNIKKNLPRGAYIQTVFDPVQTHAIYGIGPDDIPYLKEYIKKNKYGNYFRVVKTAYKTIVILCFKIKK
jgi:ABC-type amino acid transport system permease subunit